MVNLDQWGEKNPAWKADDAKYSTIHDWIRKYKFKPKECEKCGQKRHLECANISGLYKRDINDFIYVCVPCHFKMDKTKGFIGRKHSEQTKTKMSTAKKGRKLSEAHIRALCIANQKAWDKRRNIHREQML